MLGEIQPNVLGQEVLSEGYSGEWRMDPPLQLQGLMDSLRYSRWARCERAAALRPPCTPAGETLGPIIQLKAGGALEVTELDKVHGAGVGVGALPGCPVLPTLEEACTDHRA